jgi:hypothetical protein
MCLLSGTTALLLFYQLISWVRVSSPDSSFNDVELCISGFSDYSLVSARYSAFRRSLLIEAGKAYRRIQLYRIQVLSSVTVGRGGPAIHEREHEHGHGQEMCEL